MKGKFLPNGDNMICLYNGCVIPFHSHLLSLIGFCIPFDEFEANVMNHLMIIPSKLHMMSCAFVKKINICERTSG